MGKYNKDAEILKHIVKYCDRIGANQKRFGSSYDNLKNDFAYQSSCAMCVLQIGELANHLSDDIKERYRNIPWREIVGMRNLFAHDYEAINIHKLWETLNEDIDPLRTNCLQMILAAEPEYDPADDDDELIIEN